MSAATFTPGPWFVDKPCRRGTTHAIAHHPSEKYGEPSLLVAHVEDVDGFGPGNTEANARLIAAAPELLEACKLAYARLKPGDIRKDYSGHVAHVAMAKAIAKAEGSAD